MMKQKRGFSLIDSLIAMTLALMAIATIFQMYRLSQRAWFLHRERATAREILCRIKYLPTPYMDRFGTRFYDFRGQEVAASGKYQLKVLADPRASERNYWCTLTYVDAYDQPREFNFSRKEWRGNEKGI